MKVKKFFKGLLIGAAALTTTYLTYTAKKGHDFEESIEKVPETLDECAIGVKKQITVPAVPMRDMKIGAFFSTMDIDLSQVIAKEGQYDMDIEVRNATLCITLPENFRLNLTNTSILSSIYDDTSSETGDDTVTLSVFAKVYNGGLCFKYPSATDLSEAVVSMVH